jgi:hypothetical protein
MPIMPDAKLIEKLALGLANFLVGLLYLGPQRNKIPLPYPRLKWSTLPPVVVVHNYYGCDKLSRTMVTLWTMSLSYVIMSAIKIAYNPCEHSRTKHIDIRHHFLRDHAIKGSIVISNVGTNDQLANIFTKPLDEQRFHELRSELNIIDSRNVA